MSKKKVTNPPSSPAGLGTLAVWKTPLARRGQHTARACFELPPGNLEGEAGWQVPSDHSQALNSAWLAKIVAY